MALSSFSLVILFLLPTISMSISHHQPNTALKSMHFTLYQHDNVNKTGFLIVVGVSGLVVNSTASPLGSIFVLRDPLTATQDPSSKLLGEIEGTSITSSFDGLDNLSIGKITLNLKGHKGSISILGSINNLIRPSDVPVVGGTGDFLFVQGYLGVSLVNFQGANLIYKLEFHLYWPPYAASAIMD
ncbi:hypothetical protein BVRB_1g001730 [Beta vulgaris subsp. vulgaris]|nr:hypothetical protein BVRB_1g001730 [Beta vulgaris subsp. vulgaris]